MEEKEKERERKWEEKENKGKPPDGIGSRTHRKWYDCGVVMS